MTETLSGAQARRVALAAQGFAAARPARVGAGRVDAALRQMAVLQLDSVNVFARSHYLPVFSRLGAYDVGTLERMLFARRPRHVEVWAHEASVLPAEDWGLLDFRRRASRDRFAGDPDGWYAQHSEVLGRVRAELAARGPLRHAQFEHHDRGERGPWWDWGAVKTALEHLFRVGEVAIAGRHGFERRYALAEQVIPAPALRTPVPRDDAVRELIRRAARACGVATAADLADYWRIRDRPAVLAAIGELVDAGELLPVQVDGWTTAGRPAKAWLHAQAALPHRVGATAILTPFDPLVWFRDRAQRLFGFEYRIEIYTPAARRRFGYYSLPVLVGDELVGRVDLKADRPRSRLLVQSAWWEHGSPGHAAELLGAELRAAAAWQGLETISVSRWGTATDDLARVLRGSLRHDAVPVG